MTRRLAAILAADVVGYSAQIAADERAAIAALRAAEESVIEPAVAAHGGRIFKRMGDGYIVEFASVVSAVECAQAWQAGDLGTLRFRIGVHLGDVVVDGDDLLGDGINVAARLEALAEPGGICLSADAAHQLRGVLALALEDLGERELKNLGRPIRIFRLAGDDQPDTAAPGEPRPWHVSRVLLVPFVPRGDSEDLAEGVTESVAEALSCFDAFTLIDPAAAAPALADGTVAAARTLGAAFVLEGSVQAAGDRARVRVRLSNAGGQRVWSESFDRSASDAFALEDEIAAIVGSTLGEAIEAEPARAIAGKPDDELTPYEMMIRGVEHLHRVNPADNLRARDFFERAMAHAPDQWRLRVALGFTYVLEVSNGWPPTDPDPLGRCVELVREPLRRNERSPTLHRLMSRVWSQRGDAQKAIAHAERALELNPYDSDIVFNHGISLLWTGDIDRAIASVERAIDINPYAPAYYRSYLSVLFFLAARYEQGISVLSAVDGAVGPARVGRITNLVGLGRMDEAKQEAARLLDEVPGFTAKRFAGFRSAGPDGHATITAALVAAGLPEGGE